jgi:hypothetical protein
MIVKEERKTITVVFPDGRDGRTFTLKVGCVPNSVSWLLLCSSNGWVGIWECAMTGGVTGAAVGLKLQ